MGNVPIVIEIKPDELLYSWINRLARANELHLAGFAKAYIGQKGIYIGELPYDIKKEYIWLTEHIYRHFDAGKQYEDHSSLRFDLMFVNERIGMKYINNVCLNSDAINTVVEKKINNVYVCPDCIKEDVAKYGFPYLHTSHHLQGVKTCYIHNCTLKEYDGPKGHECEYNLLDYKDIVVSEDINAHIDYAKFAHDLFFSGKNVPLEKMKEVFVSKMTEKGYALHKNGYERFEYDFKASPYSVLLKKDLRFCFTNYLIKKKNFVPTDFMPLMMFLFERPQALIDDLGITKPVLIDTTCRACGAQYISYKDTYYTFNCCRNCYSSISTEDRFNNIVSVIGKNEYTVLGKYEGNMKQIEFRHKCGKISRFIPNNFLYHYSRCECEIKTDKLWNEGYEKLVQYYEEFGTCSLPKRGIYKGFKLGAWCQRIRNLKRKDKLSSDKLLLLIELGFDFAPFETHWNKMFTLYSEYAEEADTGHILRSVVYKGEALGEWYSNVKKAFREGKLKDERLVQIRKIYPAFPDRPQKKKNIKAVKYHPLTMEETVKLLLEYKDEYGTLIVPKRQNYKGYNLGARCTQLRNRRKNGELPQEYINALDDICFVWDALEYKWNEDMKRYREYVDETGIYEITREAKYKGYNVGYWYSNLKAARRNGTLTEKQRKDIERINRHFFDGCSFST